MRQSIAALFVTAATLLVGSANGQSTITNSPFDLTVSSGLWAAFLPEYENGTTSGGGAAFQDAQDELGGIVRLDAVRRALGTRTSFEANIFYAYADSSSSGGTGEITMINPGDGMDTLIPNAHARLKTDVHHFGGDLAIRDTWQTRFGGLSAGVAYSMMGFDQQFKLANGSDALLKEELDTDFQGAKILTGWDGFLRRRPSKLDFNIGIYDMQSDYSARPAGDPMLMLDELHKTTYTIETNFTTYGKWKRLDVGLTFGVMYIADMPMIDHSHGVPASLMSDDALTISCMLQLWLL